MKLYIDTDDYECADRWLLVIERSMDPVIRGPYATDQERLTDARECDTEKDAFCRLNIDTKGKPHVERFSYREIEGAKGGE
jgi:hypothetical protein